MRILVLNYEYPPLGGGAAPVCQQLCAQYARRGHEVEVVTMAYGALPRHFNDAGVEVTRVSALRRREETCQTHEMLSYVVSALPGVMRRLREERHDVMHVHFAIPTGLLAWLATRRHPIPYLLTTHGSDIPGFNPDRFQAAHRITVPLLRRILAGAAEVTSPSLYLAGLIQQAVGEIPVLLIRNGIDTSRFTPRPKLRRLLMTGRLLPRKGFQHVIDALAGISTDFEVHIAGDGPMRAELESRARARGVPVHFHGWLDQRSPELTELYETSSIFCLPSEAENASISLLEAMLAGMAVVTSNVTGCPETVGEAGFVVPPNEPQALRDVLQRLLDSESERAAAGRAARERVLAHFDGNTIADDYLDRLKAAAHDRVGR